MSVTGSLQLPGQPASGMVVWSALGGNGSFGPLGFWNVEQNLPNDVSGGTATITINLDPRYTNLVAYIEIIKTSAAAASEFTMTMQHTTATIAPRILIVGNAPIAQGISAYLWYPPPIYYQQDGQLIVVTDNIDTETLQVRFQCYSFLPDVRKLEPLNVLNWLVPGVSSPPAA